MITRNNLFFRKINKQLKCDEKQSGEYSSSINFDDKLELMNDVDFWKNVYADSSFEESLSEMNRKRKLGVFHSSTPRESLE